MIKINILKSVLFLSFFHCPLDFYGQKELNIEQCIQIALDNNLDIHRQELAIQRFEKNYKQSFFELTPNIYGSIGGALNSGRTVNVETYSYIDQKYYDGSLGIGANIILFNGFRQINSIRKNLNNLRSSVENLEKVKNDIRLSVANFYYQVLLYQELVKSSQQQLEITSSLEAKIKISSNFGISSKSDLLEILAQKSLEKQVLESNKSNLNLAYFLLKQILNDEREIQIADINQDVLKSIDLNQTVDSICEATISCLPQLKSANYQYKAAQIDLAINRGNRSPQLTLSGSYNSRYSELASNPRNNREAFFYPLVDQIKDKAFAQINISLSIPIYNKNRTNNNVNLAKISVEENKVEIEQLKKQVYTEIQKSRFEVIEAYNRYLSKREYLAYNEEIFKSSEIKYSSGLIGSLEFKIAKNNFLNAQSGMFQAKYQYLYAMKCLNYYFCK